MKHLTEEKLSVETAAAKSGVSRRTGFRIKKGLQSGSKREKKPRGRRRPDPLEGVWDSQVLPVLRNSPE